MRQGLYFVLYYSISTSPSRAQAVVEVQVRLADSEGKMRGPFLDGLYSWNILTIVLRCGFPGHETPFGPLYGTGVSEGGSVKGAYGLIMQCAPFPHPAPPSLS